MAGRPAFPYRYRNFLYACAIVAQEQVREECIAGFGGTKPGNGRAARKQPKRR